MMYYHNLYSTVCVPAQNVQLTAGTKEYQKDDHMSSSKERHQTHAINNHAALQGHIPPIGLTSAGTGCFLIIQ
jgi:hypothetical protein